MPKNIHYEPVFALISSPRLQSFNVFFNGTQAKNFELYGSYIWSQSASASIYPLMQQLEILLRNAIDREARKRFGDYWWDSISMDKSRGNWNNFSSGIKGAIRNLEREWKKKERVRIGLAQHEKLPETIIIPTFSHDDIIAATDFGTWKEVLVNAHHASNATQKNDYLWPKSMGKVFKKFNIFSNKPDEARTEILNAINELKEYRNRLFHHDCIWVKSKSFDRQSAIDTIRHKINLIEKLIECISPITLSALNTWGIISHAKRICSVDELNINLNLNPNIAFSESEITTFSQRLAPAINDHTTVAIGYGEDTMGIYKLRAQSK